jgi:hypothetical protein
MFNIKKISILLFLLAQMCVAFAGNTTDPNGRTYVGFWLVRQANDEIKQVKMVEMPATVMFEGTEDVNEPLVRQLLGYETMETFEGAAVVESLFMVMSFDSAEETETSAAFYNQSFVNWCYNNPADAIRHAGPGSQWCATGIGQCLTPGAIICRGNNICFPAQYQLLIRA